MKIRQVGTEVSYIELTKEEASTLAHRLTEALSMVEEFGDSVLLSFENEQHLLAGHKTAPTRISFEVGTY